MSAEEALERLLRGFESAGYSASPVVDSGPYDLVLDDPESGRRIFLEVKLLRLRPGGHRPADNSLRVRVPKAIRAERRGRPLTLGYSDEEPTFVGWPGYDAAGAPPGADLWVPRRTLARAREETVAAPRRQSRAYAFLPEAAAGYLDLQLETAPDPRWLPPSTDLVLIDAGVADRGIVFRREVAESRIFFDTPLLRLPDRRKSVQTGFLAAGDSPRPLEKWEPMRPGGDYRYWLSVGDEEDVWVEEPWAPLPEDLPEGARVVVRLFAFDGEIELRGRLRGELEVGANDTVRVSEAADPDEDETRLFFRVRAPLTEGRHRFRCNLYYGSTLIQSRLVSARVGGAVDPREPALVTAVDYELERVFDGNLAQVPKNDLSLMLNGGGGGVAPTHQFRVFAAGAAAGEDPLEASSSFGENQLENAIGFTRGALRKASWKSEDEWDGKAPYLYEGQSDKTAQLTTDLVRMARRGRELYDEVTGPIPTEGELRERFRKLTAKPCRIEMASPRDGSYLPAGLFYDHPLETAPGDDQSGYRLCPDFISALGRGAPLEEAACFDACPGRGDRRLVCPSGFWGFRHEIGWPVPGQQPLSEIEFDGSPELVIGISTDEDLKLRDAHVAKIAAMGKGDVAARSRDEFRSQAKEAKPHLVYFYCHGGTKAPTQGAYIILGPLDSPGIDTAYLRDEGIVWGSPTDPRPPRPLVFMNGCHTSALTPATVGSLVAGFVGESRAAGVIGTEVTIFEPLACSFAEGALGHFLDGSMSIGAAVRRARLELLRARNPLGLVYVPYVAAATRLQEAA